MDVADDAALVLGRRRVLEAVAVEDAGEVEEALLERPLRLRGGERRRRYRALQQGPLRIMLSFVSGISWPCLGP